MVTPISNTVAEIFLQHLENTHLKQILEAKNTVFYTRYVDKILITLFNKFWMIKCYGLVNILSLCLLGCRIRG